MATSARLLNGSDSRMRGSAQRMRARLKDQGRLVTYRIAGLPIAVRAAFDRDGRSSEVVIRRAYARRFWHPRHMAELVQLLLAILIWPIALLGLQVYFVLMNGTEIARRSSRPVHRQLLDQLRLYVTSGVLPPWYYIFELHEQPAKSYARDFIYRWESKGGVMGLLKEGDHEPTSIVNDKVACADQCRDRGVATIPVLAVARHATIELRADEAAFAVDLFVKPVCGRGGKGAERWDYAQGMYRSTTGEYLDRSQLLDRLAERSVDGPLLIQPRARNHPELDSINNGALSTVRMLTCLNERGEPELIGAALRMAIGDNRVVDNLHAGGIAAAVDLGTGTLGAASNLGADCRLGWMDRHPNTGAQIAGRQLPLWQELRAFAIDAHRAFSDRVLIGWDIAITPDGPSLVEANGAPDLDIHQRVVRHGMMAARLGVLLAYHVSQLGLDTLPY